jgi:hypothetical protein
MDETAAGKVKVVVPVVNLKIHLPPVEIFTTFAVSVTDDVQLPDPTVPAAAWALCGKVRLAKNVTSARKIIRIGLVIVFTLQNLTRKGTLKVHTRYISHSR